MGFACNFVAGLDQLEVPVNPQPLEGISTTENQDFGNQLASDIYNQIVSARENYAGALTRFGLLAIVYNFGMAVAIGEGELQVGSGAAASVASQWLAQARSLAAQLERIFPS